MRGIENVLHEKDEKTMLMLLALPAVLVGCVSFLLFTLADEMGGGEPMRALQIAFNATVSFCFTALGAFWVLGFVIQHTLVGLISAPLTPGLHWIFAVCMLCYANKNARDVTQHVLIVCVRVFGGVLYRSTVALASNLDPGPLELDRPPRRVRRKIKRK